MKSLIPRTSHGKSKPSKAIPAKPRYNGPIYLPKDIHNMLSEDIKKELDKYNQEKKAQYKPTHPRMAKVHEQDHQEADSPDNPEPDLENYFHDDSYPMQDSDIEDPGNTWSILSKHGIHISYFKACCFLLWVISRIERGANGG